MINSEGKENEKKCLSWSLKVARTLVGRWGGKKRLLENFKGKDNSFHKGPLEGGTFLMIPLKMENSVIPNESIQLGRT